MEMRLQHNGFRWTSTRLLLAFYAITSVCASQQQPFWPAETAKPVFKRQDGCLTNFYSCANQGAAFNGICCQNGQLCALDASNQPACCPAGAVCTGTAPGTFVTPTAVSYVPNSYAFSFPYVPTSFPNQAACSSAASECSHNFDACTSQLQGAGGAAFAVTIVVPGGGGTTVTGGGAGQVTYPTATASSACASLSSVACAGGLQVGMCSTTGANGGFYIASTGRGAPRPTAPACMAVVGAVAAGVGLAVMAEM